MKIPFVNLERGFFIFLNQKMLLKCPSLNMFTDGGH